MDKRRDRYIWSRGDLNMSRNEDHYLAAPKVSYPEYHIASFRPCPVCRRRLSTTGKGKFKCMGCGFEDEQVEKVAEIRAAGLAYSGRQKTTNNHFFMKKKPLCYNQVEEDI